MNFKTRRIRNWRQRSRWNFFF